MASKRLEVRQVHPDRHLFFDDQLWPALTSLWLLTAAVMGVIAWLGLDPWRQGLLWPVYAAIAALATSFVMSVAICFSSPRRFRRGMAMSLFLSLLLNMATACALAYVRLPMPVVQTDEEPPVEEPVEEEATTYPEFFEMADDGDDRPTQDLNKPVSTGEANRDERDLVRKTTIHNPDLERQLATAAPSIDDRPKPITIARREFVESAPRQSEHQATLSRQVMEAKPVVGTPIPQIQKQTPTLPATQAASLDIERAKPDQQLTKKLDAADEMRQNVPEPPPVPSESQIRSARREMVRRETRPDIDQPQPFASLAENIPRKRRSLEATDRQRPAQVESTLPLQPSSETASELIARASVATPQQDSLSPDARKSDMPEVTDDLVRDQPLGVKRSELVSAQPRSTSLQVELAERKPLSTDRPSPQLVDVDAEQRVAPETEQPVEAALPQPTRRRVAAVEHPLIMPSPRTDPAPPRPLMARLGNRAEPSDVPAASEIAADLASTLDMTSGVPAASIASPRDEATVGKQMRRRMLSQPPSPATSTEPLPTTVAQSQSSQRSQQRNLQPAKTSVDDSAAAQRGQRRPEVAALTMPGEGEPQTGLPTALAESGMQRAGAEQQPTIARAPSSVAMPTRRAVAINAPSLPTRVEAERVQSPQSTGGQPSVAAASRGIGRNEQPLTSAGPLPEPNESVSGTPLAQLHTQPRVARASVVSDVTPEPDEARGIPRRSLTEGSPRPFSANVKVPIVRTQVAAQILDPVPGPQSVKAPVRSGPTVEAEFVRPQLEVQALEGPTATRIAQLERQTQPLDALPRESSSSSRTSRPLPRSLASATRPPATRVGVPQRANRLADDDAAAAANSNGLVASAASSTVIAKSAANQVGAAGGLRVDVDAREGLGGLASDISRDLGSLTRKAVPDSTEITDSIGRFRRRDPGGLLATMSRDVTAASAFQTRLNRQGDQPFGGNGRPSPQTEEAIELGLVYLATMQRPDGSWNFRVTGEREHLPPKQRTNPSLQSNTAATGLSLLSYLGAGYHHRSEKYGPEVRAGLNYLIAQQKADGDLYRPMDALSDRSAQLYSHGIASIALCEAYGMTQDPDIREPAQRAIDFLVDAQHSERGGWRYAPQAGSDTSVSGWMVMAMRSGELASLNIDPKAWEQVETWLDVARASTEKPHLFRYNPFALDNKAQRHGRKASKTMTSVGLLMRMYTGWRRDDPRLVAGAQYLQANLPAVGTWENPQRDTYYWYYATQVMFHMGGEYWEAWNETLHPMLTSSQVQIGPLAGSWDPRAPIPDRWAPHAGRLYVTTMNLLSLEVFYRHLPIYEDTAR